MIYDSAIHFASRTLIFRRITKNTIPIHFLILHCVLDFNLPRSCNWPICIQNFKVVSFRGLNIQVQGLVVFYEFGKADFPLRGFIDCIRLISNSNHRSDIFPSVYGKRRRIYRMWESSGRYVDVIFITRISNHRSWHSPKNSYQRTFVSCASTENPEICQGCGLMMENKSLKKLLPQPAPFFL